MAPNSDGRNPDGRNPDDRHPAALAFEWVSKITTIVVEMVAPAWVCLKLKEHFGLSELLPIVGLVIGFVVGFTHLLFMAKGAAKKSKASKAAKKRATEADGDDSSASPS